VQHIHHGDVEHIFPKSLAPEKRFDWDNLTLACEICNQNKSDKDPLVEHIIDPYSIDPAVHLIFHGALVFPLGTPEGKSTQVILDLNRVSLVERRKERLEKVMGIFDTILREDLPLITRKLIYEDLLSNEGGDHSAYSAMVKSVISAMEKKLPSSILMSEEI
jgi:HNH endonuclease